MTKDDIIKAHFLDIIAALEKSSLPCREFPAIRSLCIQGIEAVNRVPSNYGDFISGYSADESEVAGEPKGGGLA